MKKNRSRRILTLAASALIGAGLAFAFWPRPTMVDIAAVTTGAMISTVNEEARTRVRDAYVVSTPVAGRLLRVEVQPGDLVDKGETPVARMLPANPGALDISTREQARAAVAAAEAALRVANADMNKAIADRDLVSSDLGRNEALFQNDLISEAVLQRSQKESRIADASLDTARAAISMRVANLNNAQARLISFEDPATFSSLKTNLQDAFPLYAPITGRILRVIQQSETILPAGAPILEIGDIANDLEVVVELLSTDAVKIAPGNRVIIDNWGGPDVLDGVVQRVDPWGFTKYSALGVEEQRVNAVIQFTGPRETRATLGHGFRVEARIVVWEDDAALIVPSSALFREAGQWSVFEEIGGVVQLSHISVGHNNGVSAQVLGGLVPGAQVVLYPASDLVDGAKVKDRANN